MIVRKMVFASVVSLCLMTSQAIAKEPSRPEATADKAGETETESGVINSIDIARNQLVINDQIYDYSPWKLVVRKGERIVGMASLRPNQAVRYLCLPRKPGSNLGARQTITEVWIDKN